MNNLIPTECYVEVDIDEAIKNRGDRLSIPLISTDGLVTQSFHFEAKSMKEKYKALEKKSGMLLLSIEDVKELLSKVYEEGYSHGFRDGSDIDKYTITLPKEEYINSLFK